VTGGLVGRRGAAAAADEAVPIRAITRGPEFHWRGYYDKLLFDPTDRFVLANEVEFEGRSPAADDAIRVGMIDTEDGDRWIELGRTRAWNWQQGCMLQWVPGTESQVAWNDRQDDRFVTRILDVRTRALRTLPHPFYCFAPDGRTAFACDFRRLNDTYPQADTLQHVYLYHVPTGRRVAVASFPSPEQYRGEWRCDTHPCASRSGRKIVFDSPHRGGRQVYLADISRIVG
jgi:hypothetical protein